MWFADKLGPPPKNSPQARADGPERTKAAANAAKAAPPPRGAAQPQASRPAPALAPEPEKKKKGWF